jgi:hypothetical protein
MLHDKVMVARFGREKIWTRGRAARISQSLPTHSTVFIPEWHDFKGIK